ncbi:unnamed protein product, partial [Allacma fusca]
HSEEYISLTFQTDTHWYRLSSAEPLYKGPLILDLIITISIMKIFTICLILSACALAVCLGENAAEATELEVNQAAGIVKRSADVGEAEVRVAPLENKIEGHQD